MQDGAPPPEGSIREPKAPHELHLWQVQAFRDAIFIAALVGLVWLGYALRAVTVPLLIALLLAYLFEPLIRTLMAHPRFRLTRVQAIVSILLTAGLGLFILVALLLPLTIGQTARLVRDVQGGAMRARAERVLPYVPEMYRADVEDAIELLPAGPLAPPPVERTLEGEDPALAPGDGDLPAEDPPAPPPDAVTADDVRAIVRYEIDAARLPVEEPEDPNLLNYARGWLEAVFAALGTILQFGLMLFLVPFYFFFFSLWWDDVLAFGRSLIPDRNCPRAIELLSQMDRVVSGFVRGRIVISFIMGMLLAIGWMVCGVPYAIVLGLVTGVFCAVPYLGLIGVPAAVLLLALDYAGTPPEARGLWLGWIGVLLWPAVVFTIVQLIEGYLLTPAIAGKATNLDPVTIIVAVLAGGSLMGVYGMLLAIPLAACGKILFMQVLLPRINAWARGETADPLPIER